MRSLVLLVVASLSFVAGAQDVLYSDVEIELLRARFLREQEKELLTLVPNGETKPMETIFKELGLDAKRLGEPKLLRYHHVEYCVWRVSTGYELSIMTATNSVPLPAKPLERDGYGVRLKAVRLDDERRSR